MAANVSVAAILRTNPPQRWTSADVKRWLESIGMDVYAPIFEATGVQGADLISMTADDLKKRCGVSSLGHRTQLMSQIAILSARANSSIKREGENKSAVSKRKELLETLYPDKARRENKAAMDEKLLEAREMYWTPDDRKERGAVEQNRAERLAGRGGGGGRPSSGQPPGGGGDAGADLYVTEGMATAGTRGRENAGVHRPPTNTIPSRRRVAAPGTFPPTAPLDGRRRQPEAEQEGEEEAGGEGEEEVALPPNERMAAVSERIRQLEEQGDLEGLVRAWVEYGACVRMHLGDAHPQLVRTHFYLATTYLRQKLVAQALQHFKSADQVNAQLGGDDEDSRNLHCRILEGMGLCETRLGRFSAAHSLLERAKAACMVKTLNDEGETVEELDIADPRAASVLVALSELYSAQGKYPEAVDCLVEAYLRKENELGKDHVQVGQLFNAMGTIKQKHLKELQAILADIEVILESSVRVKQQIDDKTQGMHLPGETEERGMEELVRDIANYREKQREKQHEVRVCKSECLDYLNRARKIISKAKGAKHADAVSLTKTVSVLAARFAEDEKDLIRAKTLEQVNQSPDRKKQEDETKKWLEAQGMKLDEWGLASPAAGGGNTADDGVDNLINALRNPSVAVPNVASP